MKLYVGGAWQGQEELARMENPGAEVLCGFEERIREALARGEDPGEYTEKLIREHPEAVIAAAEVGCGVVPMDPGERAWREAAGRALCRLAAASGEVTRVVCGIGVRIK